MDHCCRGRAPSPRNLSESEGMGRNPPPSYRRLQRRKARPFRSDAVAEIKWANGSRMLALPTKPQTIRGYSGNLILTEFAFHDDPDAVWSAIYPSINNPLRGGVKKLRIISTPNGLNNKFADLWLNTPGTAAPLNLNPNRNLLAALRGEDTGEGCSSSQFPLLPPVPPGVYSKSKLTIHDAIAGGLPLNAAELQAGLNDPEIWSQEYLCEFMDSSTVMFPYDLIQSCESEQATETAVGTTSTSSHSSSGQLFAGIDFGRKHHLTV